MSEGFEIIRARTKDDAAVLIDKLMRSKHSDVVLVLPKNSIITADLNSLKILKEEAESVNKELYVSTENDEIKFFAEKIQLPIYNSNSYKKKEEEIKVAKSTSKKEMKRMMDIVPPSFKMPIEIEESPAESEQVPESEHLPRQEPVIQTPVIQEAEIEAVSELKKSNDSELEKGLEDFYGNSKDKSKNRFPAINPKKIFSFKRIVMSFMGIGILLLGAALYLILPKANIRISLKEVPVKMAIPVAVSKNANSLNLASGIIPGQYFSLSKSGSKSIEAVSDASALPSKYGGFITIHNAYSVSPQKLIAQTRFETKEGKIFRIQNAVTVPGAKMSGSKLIPSSVKASVISDETGEGYKIEASYFTIPGFKGTPKYAGFYAESTEAMTPAKSNASLSNQAIEKTKETLKNELANELKNDTLGTFKDSDLKLIDGASTITIDSFKVDSKIVTMKITWQAVFFKEKDFKALVDYSVSNKSADLKNFRFEDSITYPQVIKSDFKKGEIFFTFNLDKANAFTVNLAGLRKELIGLDENGMRGVISNKNFINSASISLWPFWVKQAPNSANKINITLDK